MSRKRPREPRGAEERVPAPAPLVDTWTGCYASGWPKELLVPEAFSHPAKFAYGLIERIYDHARTEGWMPPGSVIVDPFSGVSLGAIHALRLGCAWIGCELEPRFFDIGQANLAKWMHEYRHLPGWGPWAMCVNGDSRRLLEHVPAHAECVVASPPFHTNLARVSSRGIGSETYGVGVMEKEVRDAYAALDHVAFGNYLRTCRLTLKLSKAAVDRLLGTNTAYSFYEGRLGSQDQWRIPLPSTYRRLKDVLQLDDRFDAVLLNTTVVTYERHAIKMGHTARDYGSTPGQLGAMPVGLSVSSPPYTGAGEMLSNHNGIDWTQTTDGGKRLTPGRQMKPYGTTPGQLGAMPVEMAVSSPPFTSSTQVNNHPDDMTAGKARWAGGTDSAARVKQDYVSYETAGNLAHLAVSSPPFGTGDSASPDALHRRTDASARKMRRHQGWHGETQMSPGNLANMAIASPPYADGCAQQGHDYHPERMVGTRTGYLQRDAQRYGMTDGQLGDMAVSSPPYGNSVDSQQHGIDWSKAGPATGNRKRGKGTKHEATLRAQLAYGTTEGQMGSMPDMAVSSPPWENQEPSHAQHASPSGDRLRAEPDATRGQRFLDATYGTSPNQLGKEQGDTFWAAAHAVVAQTYALLRPGAHAIWILKSYVRDKQLVDFPGQWRAMCESIGFVTLHEHHAMLVEDHGTQEGLFGDATTYTTERKSFFRRLAERRGSPKIDFEVIYCMAKPTGEGAGAACCVSSPPYNLPMSQDHNGSKGGKRGTTPSEHGAFAKYGSTPGQLEGMPMESRAPARPTGVCGGMP